MGYPPSFGVFLIQSQSGEFNPDGSLRIATEYDSRPAVEAAESARNMAEIAVQAEKVTQ